jgi:hypothetical protein
MLLDLPNDIILNVYDFLPYNEVNNLKNTVKCSGFINDYEKNLIDTLLKDFLPYNLFETVNTINFRKDNYGLSMSKCDTYKNCLTNIVFQHNYYKHYKYLK